MREGNDLPVPVLFTLAAAAMNSHVGASGFSAHQWVFGSGGGILDDEKLMPGISPHKAFGGLAKARERAKLAHEKERAAERFSRLLQCCWTPCEPQVQPWWPCDALATKSTPWKGQRSLGRPFESDRAGELHTLVGFWCNAHSSKAWTGETNNTA